jgi:hypothetical protein
MTLHPFNRRILAEELMRVRRPDDLERYAASQRAKPELIPILIRLMQ